MGAGKDWLACVSPGGPARRSGLRWREQPSRTRSSARRRSWSWAGRYGAGGGGVRAPSTA